MSLTDPTTAVGSHTARFGACGRLDVAGRFSADGDFGQEMEWNEEDMCLELVRGQRNIYVPVFDPVRAGARDPRPCIAPVP